MIQYCFRAVRLTASRVPVLFFSEAALEALHAAAAAGYLLILQVFIDAVIGGVSRWPLFFVLLLLILAAETVSSAGIDALTLRMEQRFCASVSAELLRKALALEYEQTEQKENQEIFYRMKDQPAKKVFSLSRYVVRAASSFLMMIFSACIMGRVHPALAVLFVLLCLLRVRLDFLSISKMNQMFSGQTRDEHRLSYLQSLFTDKNALYEWKIFGCIPYFLKRSKEISGAVLRDRLRATLRTQKYYVCSTVTTIVLFVCVFLWLTASVLAERVTIGMFTSVLSGLAALINQSTAMSFELSEMSRKFRDIRYYQQFLELPEEKSASPGDPKRQREKDVTVQPSELLRHPAIKNRFAMGWMPTGTMFSHGLRSRCADLAERLQNDSPSELPEDRAEEKKQLPVLEFCHVSFRYPGSGRYALQDVSFTMYAGQRIALVGANGSGKSTLAKLVCRLYRPESGEIFLYGRPLNGYSRRELQDIFAVIFQDFLEYQLSLGENMELCPRVGHVEQEEVSRVLEACGGGTLADLKLDQNLGNIEEDAVNLSKGQWQRLAVARAMLADAPFMLLDEPTAALDPIAESRLYENFAKLGQGKSSILITHRLGSVKICDQILVLDGGRLIQQGTHERLMEQEGLYRRMFREQSKWYQ